jgi:aryl-alcohol dehydrogenase-like predicted oxidoreductase
MHQRIIPSSGERLPAIGLGTWKTLDVEDAGTREPVLRAFLDGGGRLVDSSPMYGRAQQVVGELLARIRPSAPPFVATKVWIEGREAGITQMRDSIRKMGGRVDLMQVHNLVDAATHLDTLRAWKAEGVIRYVGVTHYARSAFDELERIVRTGGVDFVQLPYSITHREAEERLLPAARDAGVAVLVMQPLATGALTARVQGRPLPAVAAELKCTSWATLLLKFVLGHPAVTCPIPATSDPAHLAEDLAAAEGPLPEDPALRRKLIEAI